MQNKSIVFTLVILISLCVGNYSLKARSIEFPLLQSFVYTPYTTDSNLGKGKYSILFDIYHSNIYMFNSSRTIFNDFESLGTQLSFRYGLSKRDTLEIHFRHVSIFGGFLDKFIEDFHRLFKFPDANRRLYPQFSTQYRYFDSFSYTRRQSTMLPIVVSYLKEIYSSPAFSLKTRAAVGIPIADKPGLSSSKIFVTAGLLTGFKTKNFSVDVGNYLSLVGRPKWIPKEDIGHFLLNSNIEAYWYRFIAGFSFRTSVFKRGDISHNGYQCFVGYRVTRFLEFIILEDFAPFDTTPDISFNIRVKVI